MTGLAAGAAAYQTVNPTGSSVTAGVASIAATKTVNGNTTTATYEAGDQPVTCG